MPSIVLFSGPIASGKTTLAEELIQRHHFRRLKSSDHLRSICQQQGVEVSRATLQDLGDRLDQETDYGWLVEDVVKPQIAARPQQARWLIDSVRKERQILHFRSAFGDDVFHVHVSAPEEVLRERFDLRMSGARHYEGATTYEDGIAHPNETSARALANVANLHIDLSQAAPAEAAARVVEHLAKRL